MAGMLRKLIASGVAAKVVQEARKPENQAKIREGLSKLSKNVRPR